MPGTALEHHVVVTNHCPESETAPSYHPSADHEPKSTGWCCQRCKLHPDIETGLEKYTISWPGKNLHTKTTDPQLSPRWSQNDTEGPRAVNHTEKGTSSGRVTSSGSLHRPISKPGAQGYDRLMLNTDKLQDSALKSRPAPTDETSTHSHGGY